MGGWQTLRIRVLLVPALSVACAAAFGAAAASAHSSPSAASGARTSSPSPSPAAATIRLSPTSGPPGSEVSVAGSGFPPNRNLELYLDDPSQSLGLYGAATDGTFLSTQTIVAVPGGHMICAESLGTPPNVCAAYTVTDFQPKLTLDPPSGPFGTTVTINGEGFPANEVAALYADSPNPYLSTPGPVVDGLGQFSYKATLRLSGGSHQICADTGYPGSNQQFKTKACATFTVGSESVASMPSPSSPPAVESPITPTLAANKGAGGSFPLVPVAAASAFIVVAGVGAVFWLRRRAKSP